MKRGDYYKLYGDDAGVVWTGLSWSRFDCEGCARQMGIAITRLQGPMTPRAAEAMRGPVHHRHDINLHSKYIRQYGAKP